MTRLAVIGAGITGLVAARELAGSGAEVTVFDPGAPGGKIRTEDFLGRRVELGPDAFLTRVPHAVALCSDLGMDVDLVAPAASKAALWWDDRLVNLPAGLVLGVPARLRGVARSGLLSPTGLARAALEPLVPARNVTGDLSVRDLVASRFGAQVADRLVDPLVGGIHAGLTAELSAAATTPQLVAAAGRGRSLTRALATSPTPPTGPVFLTPRKGLGDLVDHLLRALAEAGVTIEQRDVHHVIGGAVGGRTVTIDGAEDPFDGVVMAVPAATAARLLGTDAPGGLSRIPTASVTMALLAYRATELSLPPELSGFLVPRVAGRLMTACSFASNKWPHWSDADTALLRVSTGRDGDHRHERIDDAELVDRVTAEVAEAVGQPAAPFATRVVRWPEAFPQYRVGHLDLVADIEADLRGSLPRVTLAGASYRGSGLPACIRSAQEAAAALLSTVAAP